MIEWAAVACSDGRAYASVLLGEALGGEGFAQLGARDGTRMVVVQLVEQLQQVSLRWRGRVHLNTFARRAWVKLAAETREWVRIVGSVKHSSRRTRIALALRAQGSLTSIELTVQALFTLFRALAFTHTLSAHLRGALHLHIKSWHSWVYTHWIPFPLWVLVQRKWHNNVRSTLQCRIWRVVL